jgi:isopenicillin-N N-acyltransferase like protein
MTRTFTSAVAEPAARGHEFGAVHAREVATTVAAYRRLFADLYAADVDLASVGARALRRIDDWAPELGEEIRGIASGAGMPVEAIAAINARTEIIAMLRRDLRVPVLECSAVVAVPPSGGVAVAAQNWDWYTSFADNWLEWTIPHPDGRRTSTLTEYGIVGKIGVNDAGLGLLFTMLHHRDDGEDIGVPVHVVARRVLDQARVVDDGRAICASAATSASTSVTMVAGAEAVSAELWPGGPGRGPGFATPDGHGVLVRTNHFLTDPARDGDEVPGEAPTTLTRYDTLRRILSGGGDVTADDVVAALCDHSGGVCSHPLAEEPADVRHGTLATVALDLAAGRLVTRIGPPCRGGVPASTVDHSAQSAPHAL